MAFRLLRAALGLVLAMLGTCSGQDAKQASPLAKLQLMSDIFSKAQVSGSLQYRGRCQQFLPDPPNARTLLEIWGGPPLGVLSEMYADDPDMKVTQDPDGTIRMIERGVPTGFLNVRISHISFNNVYDSLNAQWTIMGAPEVRSFMKANGIRWASNRLEGLVALPSSGMPHISGDLKNVTVSQALDYVLKTFPGFWVYENCTGGGAQRVFLEFFLNEPSSGTVKH
jgi:hypothetical protein